MPLADFSLKDRVALVTGASRGIGEAIARGLAEQGASVVLVSRRQEGLDAVAAAIRERGAQAWPKACHTARPDQIEELFQWLDREIGRIDILVNNAATNPYMGPVLDTPLEAFDKTFDLNVRGYFLMAQQAGRRMAAQGKGSIINVASIAGLSAMPAQGVYSMTKAAVIMLTKVFARELGGANVRCNAICPGLTETRFASALIENEAIYNQVIGAVALGRHAQPSEMVGTAVYLASDASSYTTGEVLVVDGGGLI
jgi:NAD(P)-dependent dehydrogenase (short-subunit alcohol dehydrogenase family)